jgi:serine/threonine protein kinase
MSTSTSTSANEHEEVQVDNIKEKVIACPYYTNRVPLSWGVGYRPYEFSIANYPPIDENIDIFGLGGVLYYILEGNDPYWQYTKDHELEEISNGLLPPIKATTTNDIDDMDTRRIINTIIDIINNSMSLNPNERPTSKHVLEQFLNAFNTTNNTS